MFEFGILDALISFVFSIQCIILIFVLIGAYALLWYSIDNFKSVVKVIRSILVPYFQPQDDVGLSEKFGQWAGMSFILRLHLHYDFMILASTFECNKTNHAIQASQICQSNEIASVIVQCAIKRTAIRIKTGQRSHKNRREKARFHSYWM